MVSVIRRYYAYRATLTNGFYLPVSVIYMEAQGLGLADIGFVQGVFLFGMVAGELPTGYLADYLGRRRTLALGNAVTATVMAGFVFASSTVGFTALFLLWSLAWTLRSGTSDAWLYELLAEQDIDGEFARLSGRAESVLLVVSAGTALTAGVLYTVDPALPFVANAAVASLGLPILFTLPGTGAADDADDEPTMTVSRAASLLREQFTRPSIGWLVVYAALFNVVFSVTRVFEQPALRAVGVPVAGLGVVYAGFKLVSAVATGAAGAVQDRLGTRGVMLSLIPIFGVLYASFAVVPLLLVPAVFARRAVSQLVRPVRNEYLNDRLGDVGRATVLSGVSMVLSLASGSANVLGGRVAEGVGPVTFLAATGVAVSVAAGVLWLLTSPVRDDPEPAAPASVGSPEQSSATADP
ncbi:MULTISPECIES: MFS transporter [Halolamina]|uniref:Major Facilitator Superfamily protein n=1 Tax=Halolamina pelagica TaxID=699431 RepID=A0A1I5P5I8_9EURY|nr:MULTISPECIES: MFS transporter [Halolamina]NHX36642.1 MFS transporter [Halolamina sp. R1-12]SFP29305.1 Major Facilitator Superfamily protein [Halolamina pelagica]